MPNEPFYNMVDLLKRLETVMPKAPIEKHLNILMSMVTVAGLPFLELYWDCLKTSKTPIPYWKSLRRAERALTLTRYFEHALNLKGAWAECGVFRGFSSLLLARVAQTRDAGFTGAGLHLIDSFEGLSKLTIKDALETSMADEGSSQYVSFLKQGRFSTPVDHVRATMCDFPEVAIHKGWIPEVFGSLPETNWAFVHLDVDLFDPTLTGLQYFYPRLADGGVIINDDYVSPIAPGAGRAWDQYCDENGLAFVVLDSGQAILIKSETNRGDG